MIIFKLIFNRWVLIAIGLVALAMVIWWVGPLIAISNFRPMEAEWVRWLQIAIIILSPVARVTWTTVKAKRANAALTRGLLQPAKEAAADPSAAEVGQLRQRFEQALGLLRKSRFGTDKPSLWTRLRALGSQRHLYELPWYVFIGAPGSGKTTALVNSGLRFPLADRMGRDAVRGVGGTRNCDWWFTDEAVFLDTAGRYTTQQSNRDVDAGAWKGFLGLLKKSRPRRPINGVIVTLSVADLLQQSAAERATHAEAVRARVHELHEQLGIHFPIYVLVTKSDLLAGFTEFFGDLGKDERAQVWGVSLPHGGQALDPAALTAELERLERRLYERLPDRLEEERDPARRALVYGLPQQFALLRERVVEMVDATFAPTKFQATALVRGIYFTSGTQEGSPIDRVLGALSRDFGLERKLLPAQQPSGRSYFLTRLLREVVFPEAGIAGIDLRWERRRRLLRTAAFAAAPATLILVTAAWWISASHNRDYVAVVGSRVEEVKKQVEVVRAGPRGDLPALLPTLGIVRTLYETTAEGSVPWSWRVGLYQGGKLETATAAAYHRMLQDTFLPSLAAYLERYLRQDSPGNAEEAYQALKTYVMLYDPKHFDRDAVWRWYATRAQQFVAGAGTDTQNTLKLHFDSLYDAGWVDPAVPRNDQVIARVRAVAGRDPLPNRIYEHLKREPVPDLREFTIADKGGAKALLVFGRASGEPLTKGVPALYTKDGYYKHVFTRIETASVKLAEEDAWVLGTGGGSLSTAAASPGVSDAIRRLYLEDYRRIWRRFVGDIIIVRGRDVHKTIEVTRVLSAPDTPLKLVMKAIAQETTLSQQLEKDAGWQDKAREFAIKGFKSMTGTGALERELVDNHFEDIRNFVVAPPGSNAPPAMDGVVQQLAEYYKVLTLNDPGPQREAAARLRADAQRQPEPVRGMMQNLIESGARAEWDRISAELRAQVGDFCLKAIGGRYPFVRNSAQDVTPEDFARLFAPGGTLDSFFQKFLAGLVDVSQKPWRFRDADMKQSTSLAEFQRAQVIRDVFFRGGGGTPSIQLDFKPLEMDASIQQFMLDVDGRIVRYAHGPQVPSRVQFPGPGGRSQVRATISPTPSSGSNAIKFEGPWALFRMFDGVQIEDSRQSERFVATITVEGRRAVFEILASSVRNPFRLPELNQFHCPTAL
jgi:type VI secretion system protein ImpL